MAASDLITEARARQAPQLEDIVKIPSALLLTLITAASRAIEKYLKRCLTVTAYTEIHDGDGTREMLLEQSPVTSFTSVVVKDDDGNNTTYDNTYFRRKDRIGLIRFAPNKEGTFLRGFQNNTVTYSAGFATIPEDVQAAAVLVTILLLAHEERDFTISIERLDTAMVQYVQDPPPKGDDLHSWPKSIIRLIAPYKDRKLF